MKKVHSIIIDDKQYDLPFEIEVPNKLNINYDLRIYSFFTAKKILEKVLEKICINKE